MSDERSNSELISEYLSILSKSGSHSPQAREFLAEHQDRPAFQSISDRSKREESYIDQQAKRAGKRRRRALYWVLGSSIALVIIGVTLLIGWIASLVTANTEIKKSQTAINKAIEASKNEKDERKKRLEAIREATTHIGASVRLGKMYESAITDILDPDKLVVTINESEKNEYLVELPRILQPYENEFVSLLVDGNEKEKDISAYAMRYVNLSNDEIRNRAIRGLIGLLRGHMHSTRQNASRALGHIGKKALPELKAVLDDPNIRGEVIATIGRVSDHMIKATPPEMLDPKTIDRITTYLNDGKYHERQRAAFALSRIKLTKDAKPPDYTLNTLITIIANTNEDPKVLDYCIIALGNMGEGMSEKPINNLVRILLTHEYRPVWTAAARSLGKLRGRSVDTLSSKLSECAKEGLAGNVKQLDRCFRLVMALDQIGAHISEKNSPPLTADENKKIPLLFPQLKAIIDNNSMDSRLVRVSMLALSRLAAKMKMSAKKTYAGVATYFKDNLDISQPSLFRRNAARALGEMRASEKVDDLIESLQNDPDDFTKANSAYSLGKISLPAATAALSELTRATFDDDPNVRRSASAALKQMSETTTESHILIDRREYILAEKDDLIYRGGYYFAIQKINLTKGMCYRVDLTSMDFDTYLYFKAEINGKLATMRLIDGREIKNDDGGQVLNSRLYFYAEDSIEVAVFMTSYSPGHRGACELTVREFGSKKR